MHSQVPAPKPNSPPLPLPLSLAPILPPASLIPPLRPSAPPAQPPDHDTVQDLLRKYDADGTGHLDFEVLWVMSRG